MELRQQTMNSILYQNMQFLCHLKRRHIGITLSATAASGFPCSENNFVTVGSNAFKLGMHVSGIDPECTAQEP